MIMNEMITQTKQLTVKFVRFSLSRWSEPNNGTGILGLQVSLRGGKPYKKEKRNSYDYSTTI